MKEEVILVTEKNKKIGTCEKMEAHKKGLLHRAVSILIFNSKGEMMLQQRAEEKYHSGGLWSNACCTHPRPNEKILESAHRRLKEEMGFDCELKKDFAFLYKVNLDHGLIENEYDTVFTGKFDGIPRLNPKEAMNYKWISLAELNKDVKENPQNYTEWFKIILKRFNKV